VTDPKSVEGAASVAWDRTGGCESCLNAGVFAGGHSGATLDDWDWVMGVNLRDGPRDPLVRARLIVRASPAT
jgi:hypothetical protein